MFIARAIVFVFLCNLAVSRQTESLADEHADKFVRVVYSVGDLHGDYERFQQILQALGLAVFEEGGIRWTGGDAILVSTGDSVDRGEHGRSIYMDFKSLAEQAQGDGGEVINIVGNHELMNLQGDFRYVHPSEFEPDGDYGGRDRRSDEWAQHGLIGADIRTRFVAAALREGTVFVHGGLDPSVLDNHRVEGNSSDPLETLNAKVKELLDVELVPFRHELFGSVGPFWNRFFAEGPEEAVCARVAQTLRRLRAKRMVLGHTPQENGVNVRCATPSGPRIILADTVISRAYEYTFGFSLPSAVQYKGDVVTALYFPADGHRPVKAPLHPSGEDL